MAVSVALRHTGAFDVRLLRLADDAAIIEHIDRQGAARGWWASGRQWRRTFGRRFLDESRYCAMLFEAVGAPQELCLVEAFDELRYESAGKFVSHAIGRQIGALRLSRFPCDPGLPTLARLLSGLDDVRVLRYRPGKRCTLSTGEDSGRRFGKVFADDRGALIHRGSEQLWDASVSGSLGFDVARPLGWDPELRTLWQGVVPGQSITATLRSDAAAAVAFRMGVACASLAVSGLEPPESFDGNDQCERTSRYAAELARWLPGRRDELNAAVECLRERHSAYGGKPALPIHGAPHAHQWLDSGSRLGLVDFDRFCTGDPELDVATFVAETDFEDTGLVPVERINEQFVSGYESVYGPLDWPLVQLYRTHKYLAKALKAARSVSPRGLPKAERHLERAIASLGRARP